MTSSHIEKFARFVSNVQAFDFTAEVIEEAKRVILDTIGCGFAAVGNPTAQHGVDYARIIGGDRDEATVIGSSSKTSVHGAAFANAELTSALDYHPINLPGHVMPYVLPVALAVGEQQQRTGREALASVIVGLEMSYRFAQTMDRNRDVKDGVASTSPVLGYANTVFGITSAAAIMKHMSEEATGNALAIAAATSPVNAHRAWLMHTPTPTTKYNLMPGGLVLSALNAAYMADLGHRGDKQILEDEEYGYPQFIGTRRWEPSGLTEGLGEDWGFVAASQIKPWPHCRVTHPVLDAITQIVVDNDIHPDQIESLNVWGEAWATGVPTFMNREIERPFDAQWSFAHGAAVAAHRIPPGKKWQDPEVVYNESVVSLMSRVKWDAHPDWASAVLENPVARPTRVEIIARGKSFVEERNYARGARSPEPSTFFTNEELENKFRNNSAGIISIEAAESVIEKVASLEAVENIGELTSLFRPAS